ncbi:acyltransferase family protein [Burkholderia ubonensis]|uniref:acyltransferase family protein n=1 Tax=Burkholderia ubonensis TaxID=101571 RepID=UPI0009B52831|nr:acyltransferase [Burkholderia ubonensis]
MTKRNLELDVLRGFAVLLVIFEHASLIFQGRSWWDNYVDVWFKADTGVDLFFVISGFVISATFLRSFDDAQRQGGEAAATAAFRFYAKRFVRLYPAVLVWATITLIGAATLNQSGIWLSRHDQFMKFVSAIAYVANFNEMHRTTSFGYLWSLSVEMQFYLVFPLFLLFVRDTKARIVVLAALFLARLLWQPFGTSWWLGRFDGILIGILLYILSTSPAVRAFRPTALSNCTARTVFMVGALLTLATVLVALPLYPYLASGVACLISGALVWAATYDSGYVSRLGLSRVIDWIGSRSYSLYLAHLPVMLINRSVWYLVLRSRGVELNNADHWRLLLLSWVIMAIAATEVTYQLLEKPFVKRSQKIGKAGAIAAVPIHSDIQGNRLVSGK